MMRKDLNVSFLLDIYGRFLSDKQRELTEYYYNDDLSLSEIAENEGITRQGVCDNIKRAQARLYSWEEECKYGEQFSRLKQLSAALQAGDQSVVAEIADIIDSL